MAPKSAKEGVELVVWRGSSHNGDVRVRGNKRLGWGGERVGRVARGAFDGVSVEMRERLKG